MQTDPNEVPEITPREVEAALRRVKNTKAPDINIETLKAGKDTIWETPAKLYTKMFIRKTNMHNMEERIGDRA